MFYKLILIGKGLTSIKCNLLGCMYYSFKAYNVFTLIIWQCKYAKCNDYRYYNNAITFVFTCLKRLYSLKSQWGKGVGGVWIHDVENVSLFIITWSKTCGLSGPYHFVIIYFLTPLKCHQDVVFHPTSY